MPIVVVVSTFTNACDDVDGLGRDEDDVVAVWHLGRDWSGEREGENEQGKTRTACSKGVLEERARTACSYGVL